MKHLIKIFHKDFGELFDENFTEFLMKISVNMR